jgi:hypothetical protein
VVRVTVPGTLSLRLCVPVAGTGAQPACRRSGPGLREWAAPPPPVASEAPTQKTFDAGGPLAASSSSDGMVRSRRYPGFAV